VSSGLTGCIDVTIESALQFGSVGDDVPVVVLSRAALWACAPVLLHCPPAYGSPGVVSLRRRHRSHACRAATKAVTAAGKPPSGGLPATGSARRRRHGHTHTARARRAESVPGALASLVRLAVFPGRPSRTRHRVHWLRLSDQ
jgi:hypothetical protein